MTSNIGSSYLFEGISAQGEITQPTREAVMNELRSHFRPEFLNRVDDIVIFKPLTLEEIEKIVNLLVNDLRKRLQTRQISLELTEPAVRFIAQSGFDPVYGARPLKRFITRELETRIGRALIKGDILDGARVRAGVENDRLVLNFENPQDNEGKG
jgi:ATP-dependent Clp protease ATP-binding subunit ClpB